MTWLYTLVGGLIAGIGGTVLVIKSRAPVSDPVQPIIEQIEVQKNLTEPDLLEVPCSDAYIEKHGEGLCREMFCRMTTRGIDSKTSGQECEEIANLLNSLQMLEACSDQDPLEDCYDVFRYRK
tara:strand:+ start:10001 stop:10369 length:369 start_codon:yes stop_codon:yes gene_type:complete